MINVCSYIEMFSMFWRLCYRFRGPSLVFLYLFTIYTILCSLRRLQQNILADTVIAQYCIATSPLTLHTLHASLNILYLFNKYGPINRLILSDRCLLSSSAALCSSDNSPSILAKLADGHVCE